MKLPGDKAINRAAQQGTMVYLFGGQRYGLDPSQVYGTKIEKGKRVITRLLLPREQHQAVLARFRALWGT